MASLLWRLRHALWENIVLMKYRSAKPAAVPLPPTRQPIIGRVPISQVHPSIHIEKILVADSIPADEDDFKSRLFYKLQSWLGRVFGPNQPGLQEVPADPTTRLQNAYGSAKRRLFPEPMLPDAFQADEPDLGRLAVAGPYWGYLESAGDGRWQWDLRELGYHEHWPELFSLGSRVIFEADASSRSLQPVQIECELGSLTPGDIEWPIGRNIALCAITTHVSLVRHFNGIHLAIGAPIAMATRNRLPHNHPVCRLLWPHIYRSQFSNDLITLAQLAPEGDFPNIFSFTPQGVWDLLENTNANIRLEAYDPDGDARARGVEGAPFDTPTLANLKDLFGLFLDHATAYIQAYYETDASLTGDQAVREWLAELDSTIPNGVPMRGDKLTREGLARLIALLIYVVVVEHEFRGTFLWNYQPWTHMQPIRVYRDGRREPVDVYQRLLDANLILNVNRTVLDTDFSYLGLDEKGAELFRRFRRELQKLQASLNDQPRHLWKLYPDMLNANMNA